VAEQNMDILIGFALIALMFVVFAVTVIRSTIAAARQTGALPPAGSSNSQLSDLRLILQHNESQTPLDTLLGPLVTVDPQFSSAAFAKWAADALTRIVEYSGTAPATQLPVTATFADRLTQDNGRWHGSEFAPVVKDLHLDSTVIEAVRIDSQQQAIDVRFTGSWVHYVGSADGATVFDGSAKPVPLARRGTFVRPAGATSAKAGEMSDGAAGGHCPHCGAAVTTGSAVCPYCGVQLDQAAAPWLLDSLADAQGLASLQTSSGASHPKASTSLGLLLSALQPGGRAPTTFAFGMNLKTAVERISSSDPNFSQQRFVKWATQAYLRERLQRDPTTITIQKSDLFGVIVSDKDENIIVLFNSSASASTRLIEAVVFSRPVGSVTPPPIAAPDTMCSGCGAPLTAGDTACRFCGLAIPDVEGAWKLDNISAGVSQQMGGA
jgi:hypothetical protein